MLWLCIISYGSTAVNEPLTNPQKLNHYFHRSYS